MIYILTAVFLHELAHYIAAWAIGFKPSDFIIRGFGIEMCSNNACIGSSAFMFIAAAGPIFSFVLAICGYMFGIDEIFYANIAIAAVNFLPALPLDGGQIFYGILTGSFSRSRSKKVCRCVGVLTGTVITLLGIYILCMSRYNFSLMYIGLFVLFTNMGKLYNPVTEVVCSRESNFAKSSIFVLDENMPAIKAANAIPANAIGAVRNSDGGISGYITAGFLYNRINGSNAGNTVGDLLKTQKSDIFRS